jgi:hypothetical protein
MNAGISLASWCGQLGWWRIRHLNRGMFPGAADIVGYFVYTADPLHEGHQRPGILRFATAAQTFVINGQVETECAQLCFVVITIEGIA